MRYYFSLLIFGTLLLAGCARDVNLAQDVDLLMPSPSSQLETTMKQTTPMQTTQPTAQPTTQPTTKPTGTPEPATVKGPQQDVLVDLITSKGAIRLKLYSSKAPNTVANFLKKGSSGFYKGLTFHRVEDWVIQGGDPQGTGRGGGTMSTELNQEPFKAGSLGVARGGDIKVSNDSQFFICTTDCSWLTGQYTNFGEVVSGMEVATSIAIGDKIDQIVEVKE